MTENENVGELLRLCARLGVGESDASQMYALLGQVISQHKNQIDALQARVGKLEKELKELRSRPALLAP